MPALMPNDTAAALGDNAKECQSRSLFFDRFANPAAKDAGDGHLRRDWFNELLRKSAVTAARTAMPGWSSALTSSRQAVLLYAQLQSRLMVNLAGGVMENAGLCLDRFGMPYIPGSAVKGCARRAALAALHEWCETGQKPGACAEDKDNLFQSACAPFAAPADMLAAIARVFGWCEQDWSGDKDKEGRSKSDFAWACGGHWDEISASARKTLGSAGDPPAVSGDSPDRARQRRALTVARDSSGSVSFLPAYPVDLGKPGTVDGLALPLPELGKLELDVVTCHHREYYGEPDRAKDPRTWEEWNRKWGTAPDTEEPNPVVFPAVAPGHVFVFALARLRGCSDSDLAQARAWLACGLSTFGLGAKTNAGYGWFQDVTKTIHAAEQAAQKERAERERVAQEQAERDAARATLQPDPALIDRLRAMKEQDLRGQINPYATEPQFWTQKDERVQLTVLHFLLVTAPEQFAADRANAKTKTAKAIAHLAAKFPHVASTKP